MTKKRAPKKTRVDLARERRARQNSIVEKMVEVRTISGPQLRHIYHISKNRLQSDITELRALGHDIRGEPGVGYMYVPSKTKGS